MDLFVKEKRSRAGIVSHDIPLISNLNVRNNISLILQYHRNMPAKKAGKFVDECLERLGIPLVADKRISTLSTEENFLTMLLRAAMMEDAILVLDRPFSILTNITEDYFIMDTLEKIDDLFKEAYIFDCIWRKLRYRRLDGA